MDRFSLRNFTNSMAVWSP